MEAILDVVNRMEHPDLPQETKRTFLFLLCCINTMADLYINLAPQIGKAIANMITARAPVDKAVQTIDLEVNDQFIPKSFVKHFTKSFKGLPTKKNVYMLIYLLSSCGTLEGSAMGFRLHIICVSYLHIYFVNFR